MWRGLGGRRRPAAKFLEHLRGQGHKAALALSGSTERLCSPSPGLRAAGTAERRRFHGCSLRAGSKTPLCVQRKESEPSQMPEGEGGSGIRPWARGCRAEVPTAVTLRSLAGARGCCAEVRELRLPEEPEENRTQTPLQLNAAGLPGSLGHLGKSQPAPWIQQGIKKLLN